MVLITSNGVNQTTHIYVTTPGQFKLAVFLDKSIPSFKTT